MRSLLTLNLADPTRERATALLEWLWATDDDVWVLTETGRGEGTRLVAAVCRAAGHQVHLTDSRERGVMVVVRNEDLSLEPEDLAPPPLLPGRVLPARVDGLAPGGGPVRLLGVYGAASDPVRYSSAAQRRRKREWIAALEPWLGGWLGVGAGVSAVVAGDLNWADPVRSDTLSHVLPEEEAALARLSGEHGLVDAFRHHHPRSTEVSWVDHSGVGCRYDHAFVSPDLVAAVGACDLVHEPRAEGLTDHSGLRLVLSPSSLLR